jgi:flagellar basal body rod protein FlgB
MVAQRHDLVAALVACADTPFRARARRFASGLSADELQFIAEYLGACILEATGRCCMSRAELAQRIADFQRTRRPLADRDHKSILLLEFLCRTGVDLTPAGRIH